MKKGLKTSQKKDRDYIFGIKKLFLASGEAHTRAKLYDAHLHDTGPKEPARMANLVKRYSLLVEGSLQELRALVNSMEVSYLGEVPRDEPEP